MANQTRLTLTSRVREFIQEPDEDNSHFTDVQLYSFLNQAIRFLGTDIEWPIQTSQATAVLDQAVYTLPENFISLLDVYFDNNPLMVIDRSDLKQINLAWQDAESGIPRYAYKSDNRKFGVYPKPDADNADLLIQIQYIKVPEDIEDDTSNPDLHVSLQDCLPYYAAYLCHESLGNMKAADKMLERFEFHKKKLLAKVQRFSDDLYRFRWSRYGI